MTLILKIAHTRTLLVTIALLAIAACDGGDEYTEDGQPVEKTDVRAVRVDFGRTVDSSKRLSDTTDTFAPTDHVFASVRTKGSSPKTTLGVRWKNPMGDEINSSNVWIRPTGDTSTVFDFSQQVPWTPGQYTLLVRVNGKEVKTAHFTVGDREAATVVSLPGSSPTQKLDDTSGVFSAMISSFRSGLARLTFKAAVLIGREPKDQSPFEWKGLRAGMRFSKVDRLSYPAAPWKRTPFILNVVGFERYTAVQNKDLGAGTLTILADTAADRVLEVNYAAAWIPHDSTQRLAFEREMVALGLKWDKMPRVIRQQSSQSTGPYSFAWATPDSAWKATIFYEGSVRHAGRPTGFQIQELHWDQRVFAQISDSMKGLLRNPNSEYYHPRPPAK